MNTKIIKKRDGKIVSFEKSRIYNAICKAMIAVGDVDKDVAKGWRCRETSGKGTFLS